MTRTLALLLALTTPTQAAERATIYAPRFAGHRTASGEVYRPDALTVASNRHRLGAPLLLRYRGRVVRVRVNDRCGRCVLDLAPRVARALGVRDVAVVEVGEMR